MPADMVIASVVRGFLFGPACLVVATAVGASVALAQQVAIPRIEQMPNLPSPYQMRDWRQVAIGYDEFVFDFLRTGTYLPLGWRVTNTVNYPEHDSFGLTTVVGTPREKSAEAINVLPALVGATLVGIDKSNQSGENWVLMAEEFFNRRPEENIYLNLPVTKSGDDWWYETMPNVFFYQLYDLYRGTGDFAEQFTTVADQWLRAVHAMGGGTTPWTVPFMNYRAWSFSTMKPLATGVREPEAAGAIAWLLYNAYAETGAERYRIGAEWATEFLSGLTTNPSYELQLPYGVYAAARMNAELGTNYNVEKMLNWCFNIGPLRSWGALLGTWGGYDVHGLIGEDSFNDYAFMMNGYQQAGALVPMTRYDDRFARAIGKWVLNLANASRLFYPNYLPANHQDSEEWAFQYDPESYIGHEALRQEKFGLSPYATGDAIDGGWGYTNLVLYGSSHVGILGGIIDTTDVPGVLRLDLLRTDYFRSSAYDTYLYYNPHAEVRMVSFDVGTGTYDLYDVVSNQFVAMGASGLSTVSIPADGAAMIVRAPAGGMVTYEKSRMLIDGVVVDYRSSVAPGNYPPRIKSLAANPSQVFSGGSTVVYCTAEDREGATLGFDWSASGGRLSGSGSAVTWEPAEAGSVDITCSVNDGQGGSDTERINVTAFDNHIPVIESVLADPEIIDPGDTTTLQCLASDLDGDTLSYAWYADTGSILGQGSAVTWESTSAPGYHVVLCTVDDGRGATAVDSTGIVVGRLVGDYPFNGSPMDESGFGNHASVSGVTLVEDRSGIPNSAYAFDGVDDHLVIASHPSLDFRDAVTVALWMRAHELFSREAFLISHGSWQNRWKISIVPERRIRWTIRTNTGIEDLDSQTVLVADSLYHVAVTYGTGMLRIYLNGKSDASSTYSGRLNLTGIALTIGQMLPGDTQWNFKGDIDDVRIYNRALSDFEVAALYGESTSIDRPYGPSERTTLHSSYPNPFAGSTTILYQIGRPGRVTIRIFDVLGREVRTLFSGYATPGSHRLAWDGLDNAGGPVASGHYFAQLKSDDGVVTREMIRLNLK